MGDITTMNCRFDRLMVMALGAAALPGISLAAELNGKPATFAKDVAPILQEKCQGCHRVGSMAPMSLVTYEEVRPWAKSIKQRVVTRNMPPWHLDKTVGIQQFQNDMSLSDEQIGDMSFWNCWMPTVLSRCHGGM